MKKLAFLLLTIIALQGCSQQQARKPISHSSGTFLKESVDRNKKLISGEEAKIDSIIKSEPNAKYIASQKGYWYRYDKRNTLDTLRPKKGDVARFNYEIKDLDGNVIYSELELRPQTYRVDKEQKIIMGLRHGIKLMHKNETVTFLFPSHMAYGYHGDDRRIGHNQPIICTVTLADFNPEEKIQTE
ncbi:gliding motility-associated peptidyl-prolyl isomerase GldI [Flavobacterium sp. CYK-4]|uniref:gliding motility-associated peptidyl-prolyl isomerase GldI n=1 Tax=Flavobacterium lotistagni TaxID=2709660 RepID=UPI00140CAC1E|nr:gliding motility-associated peptidyl-prolyl isomerase GldI [Flavobacterium lotistagni]NHM07764.1 gliding motility-associated peptidyl-prolyl isomerase GldI [Flavobacterium lotistagni]